MSLKAKKIKMMEIISSIKDEKLLDQISSKVIPLIPINGDISNKDLIEKYRTSIEPKFDLEKIIEAQNYQGLNLDKIDKLIEELDIEEPLEDLIKMI